MLYDNMFQLYFFLENFTHFSISGMAGAGSASSILSGPGAATMILLKGKVNINMNI
jgi:hypothetical protein